MLNWSATPLLLLALLCTASAHAGSVETNVRICGKTDPYQRYGELAPGLFGNSSSGLRDQFYRFKGNLGIEANTDAPELLKADAIADFVAATAMRGTRMCVRGNLETVERAGSVLYYMTPKTYQITEKTEEYLNPSQLPGNYTQALPSAPTLTLLAIDDAETGRKFVFNELPTILRSLLGAPCGIIDKAILDPASFSLVFRHKDERTVLAADAFQECAPNDALKVHVELRKTSLEHLDGAITVERPANGTKIFLEIHR